MTENNTLRTEAGMTPAWAELAVDLRTRVEALGVTVSRCLPGEIEDCGADYAHHCFSYGAAITAHGLEVLQHLHHDESHPKDVAERLVDHWRQRFAANGEHCSSCVRPPAPPE